MTKFFNKNSKNPVFGPFLVHFPNFGGKKFFQERLCHANLYRFLAPCQNLEKTNDTIPRKQSDRCKDGRMEGWAERRTDLLPSGAQKKWWELLKYFLVRKVEKNNENCIIVGISVPWIQRRGKSNNLTERSLESWKI